MKSLRAGPGLLLSGSGRGAVLTPFQRTKIARRVATVTPFKIDDASTTSGGTTTLKLGVVSGTVNGVVPTLGGTALDATPAPTLTITATRYLWLKCVGTFGSPDTYAVTVEDSATSATPAGTAISGTAFTSFLLIGYATVASGAITSITQSTASGYNWNVESYGSVNEWWR